MQMLIIKRAVSFFMFLLDMTAFLSKHGDAVKDIAFEVEDLDAIFKVGISAFTFNFQTVLLIYSTVVSK